MAPLLIIVIMIAIFSPVTSGEGKPNILFILADDQGWNDIGYHGSEIQTPVLDALAAEGVKLENYYTQPLCTPSRCEFLSGRHLLHTGMQHRAILPGRPKGLPVAIPTIAEKIREAGYSTHMIGKWHVGHYTEAHLPVNRGFDTFLGYYQGSEDYYNHTLCMYKPRGVCGLDLHNGTRPVRNKAGVYSANMFVDEAVRIIQGNKDSDKPMFMYLAMQNVHSPMEAPDRYSALYKGLPGYNREMYAGMVAALDEAIDNVTKALKNSGLSDNTIIIYSSDNGAQPSSGGSNWPLRGEKGTLWEGGIRSVAFAAGKPVKRRGVVSRELMHVSDWFPTLVNLAGGSLDGIPLDGFDQWATITEGTPSPRKEILYNIDPLTPQSGTNLYGNATFPTSMRGAIRVGDMKLITGDPGPGLVTRPDTFDGKGPNVYIPGFYKHKNLWLYNITADPLEQTDVSSENPALVLEMLDKLKVYQDGAVPAQHPPYDPRANPKYHEGSWEPWL